jgi:hypothetical protein
MMRIATGHAPLSAFGGPSQVATRTASAKNQTPNPDGRQYLLALPIHHLCAHHPMVSFRWLTTGQKTQPASTIFHTEIHTIIHSFQNTL